MAIIKTFATDGTLSYADIDANFTNINDEVVNLSNDKADLESPEFTGTPEVPTAVFGDNTNKIASTQFVQIALQAIYPIGSVYTNASNSSNPATIFGFGIWEAFGSGRVLVGVDSSDPLFDTVGEVGGSKNSVAVEHTHTATVNDPGHNHTAPLYRSNGSTDSSGLFGAYTDGNLRGNGTTNTNTTGISVSLSTSGESGINKNLQPYITVFMWKRVS